MPSPEHDAAASPQTKPQASNSDQTASFEDSLAALGDTVTRLESGTLGLSASIAAYERGVTILRRLHDELAAVEERVKLLVQIDEHGRPVLAPLPQDAETPAATPRKAAGRGGSAAKNSRAKTLPGMDDATEEA